jgi:hypothetical protein
MVTKKAQYDMDYIKKHIKRITLDMQKSYFEETLAPAAKEVGEPINTFIKTAIAERIERMKKGQP